jgi:hypothetical protein
VKSQTVVDSWVLSDQRIRKREGPTMNAADRMHDGSGVHGRVLL